MQISDLYTQMIEAGIPVEGLDSEGNIYFLPDATPEQQDQAQQIMDAWLTLPEEDRDMTPTRESAYAKGLAKRLKALEDEIAEIKTKIE